MELGVYVHIPFCVRKCAYCDFNSYAMSGEVVERCVRACEAEIRRSPRAGSRVGTVFFGGGTPTFLTADQLTRLLHAVRETFAVAADAEITSEANPGTADAGKFSSMRQAGFNRLSIGAQSFDDRELARLERVHRAAEIGSAVAAARAAGFDDLNLDLMYALPGQTVTGWLRSLEAALALRPEHLSLYCLTIEPGTPFHERQQRGELDLPDEKTQVAMQMEAARTCAAAGLRRYEISNFARPGRECRHNLVYWRNEEYVGFGPGSASYVDGQRWSNVRHPEEYIAAVESGEGPTGERERLEPDRATAETLMLGLRLTEGISFERLERRHPGALSRLRAELEELVDCGWLAMDGDRMWLTDEGMLFHDEVTIRLLP
jgi:oxygen-independent coproporphyrinogen-3 oxidase